MPVSILGAGRMGSAIARVLLGAGHEVTVWNRSSERAQPLIELGARQAGSVLALVHASRTTIVCVQDYAASDSLLRRQDVVAALASRTLVQTTTGSPSMGREAAEWASSNGIGYLEGYPVAYDDEIGTEGATLVFSGSHAVFDAHADVLNLLGRAVFLGEDPGLANAMLVATVPPYHGAMLGILQGASLAVAEGISAERYGEIMLAFMPSVDSMVADLLRRIATREYDDPRAAVVNQIGASAKTLEACREARVSASLPALYAACFEGARGLIGFDVAAMFDYFGDPDFEPSNITRPAEGRSGRRENEMT